MKTIEQALKDDDVRTIETTRKQVREFMDLLPSEGESQLADALEGELDEAQGEADAPGKVSYVVLKIEGESL